MQLEDRMQAWRTRVEARLEACLPAANLLPEPLHQAMRYAVLGGGKRIRPVLVYAAGHAVGADEAVLDAPAAAVELIHAYSLVHDDLPAMDDDDLRRGRPTCHKVYGEAQAILAGDALQALAFEVLAGAPGLSGEQRASMTGILASASGSRGMAGGQSIDLAAVGAALTLPELEIMHIHKTGALIRASVRLGALCQAQVEAELLERLDRYAKCVGLAFQIRDDILDEIGDTATLGKTQGADRARSKPTYPALLGLDGARERARELHQAALEAIAVLDERAAPLRELSARLLERSF